MSKYTMKSICKASTNWIDGFYCFNFSTLLHICVKNWRQKKLRFHAPIPFSWDIKSILIPERKRGKKREMMLSLLALYSLKNKKKIFFLHFTLHHFLLSVCSNGKKKYDVIFQETGLLPTKWNVILFPSLTTML